MILCAFVYCAVYDLCLLNEYINQHMYSVYYVHCVILDVYMKTCVLHGIQKIDSNVVMLIYLFCS